MNTAFIKWADCLKRQIEFYQSGSPRRRSDEEWIWYEKNENIRELFRRSCPSLFSFLRVISGRKSVRIYSNEWFSENSDALWTTRLMLQDDLSRILFDNYLLLRCSDPSRFFYPRVEFSNFLNVDNKVDFVDDILPSNYGKDKLKIFDIQLNEHLNKIKLKIVASELNLQLFNTYRQYFIQRDKPTDISFIPRQGEVVFDCGACIGEISTIFAGFVGENGQVHTFDPTPLHTRFIELHSILNPSFKSVFYINELAVDRSSKIHLGTGLDTTDINPGPIVLKKFNSISLDEYTFSRSLSSVDFIKMDIEGYEQAALHGSKSILKEFKPRLAICAYHKPEDLWEIPLLIKSFNPGYKLYFEHHTSLFHEAVFYAD